MPSLRKRSTFWPATAKALVETTPGQLVLPENLKEFSMYTLGLLKSRAFKAGAEPSDRRSHAMRLIKSASPLEISLFLYPRIIAIHNLADTDGFHPETGHLEVPNTLRASFSRIEEGAPTSSTTDRFAFYGSTNPSPPTSSKIFSAPRIPLSSR